MSSYWLKIASRAGAKNRRIYKPRRFAETRCTYAAVARKVETLRETEREREIAKGRRPLFSRSRVTAQSFTRKTENGKLFSFSASPGLGVARLGGGGYMTVSFLPQQVMLFFFFFS
ncbi:hypothetical protein QQF64_032147 [Cirrhinus molitorella]|uniref:Uncharacterized protein n=1 Tax=Cirrhinus molitorella TaxID=172907 RepID=A0ABR3MYZ2_9TELE